MPQTQTSLHAPSPRDLHHWKQEWWLYGLSQVQKDALLMSWYDNLVRLTRKPVYMEVWSECSCWVSAILTICLPGIVCPFSGGAPTPPDTSMFQYVESFCTLIKSEANNGGKGVEIMSWRSRGINTLNGLGNCTYLPQASQLYHLDQWDSVAESVQLTAAVWVLGLTCLPTSRVSLANFHLHHPLPLPFSLETTSRLPILAIQMM